LLFAYEDMTSKLALERSYNTLIAVQKATLDNLQEGIVVFGADGRLKLNNPIYAKLWNLDFEFLQSSPHMLDIFAKTSNCFLSEELEWLKQQFIETLNNRQISNYQLELVSGRVFSCMAIPLPDGATLITYCDVTDSTLVERSLRELNKALQDADRIKTEFLANVSYELRSPLTSIMGFSEALGQEYFGELNQHQKEYVEGIFNSSQYLMSLINDILDLASIEAGYMKLDVSRFDVRNAAIAVLSLVQERIKEAKLQLQFECQPNIGTMIGDEKRIKQVVFKLLSNAIKFNRSGGNIILTLNEIMPDNIIITIEDTGIGIDIEEQESVFNKFYQNQHNKQSGRSGAGLGLSFVKSFIELHGGTISIESSKNVYTKVCCILPRENPALLTDYKDNKQDDSSMKTTIPLTA
jgi:signal transduction histidine kinase